jgi:hypothetical protein
VDRSGPLVAALTLALVYVVGPWLDTRGEAAGVWTRRRWISLAAGVSVAYPFVLQVSAASWCARARPGPSTSFARARRRSPGSRATPAGADPADPIVDRAHDQAD